MSTTDKSKPKSHSTRCCEQEGQPKSHSTRCCEQEGRRKQWCGVCLSLPLRPSESARGPAFTG